MEPLRRCAGCGKPLSPGERIAGELTRESLCQPTGAPMHAGCVRLLLRIVFVSGQAGRVEAMEAGRE